MLATLVQYIGMSNTGYCSLYKLLAKIGIYCSRLNKFAYEIMSRNLKKMQYLKRGACGSYQRQFFLAGIAKWKQIIYVACFSSCNETF